MSQRYIAMLRGLSAHILGRLGVAMVTSSFLLFLVFEFLRITGALTNAYIGLITYMLFPAVFILGLLLIPLGWWFTLKKTGMTSRELLNRQFPEDELKGSIWGSGVFTMILVLTGLNLLFLGGGSARVVSFMDSAEFCGTACHGVMNPEWVTYQSSPHAHVACVDCHVGEGAGAALNAKLNGLRQVVSATFDLYEKPVPTPVHQLRPARETCEKCHWPEKTYDDRLRVILNVDSDEANSYSYTTLGLKVGAKHEAGSIHWHIAEENAVRYASVDDKREEMIWVEWLQKDGSWKRYENKDLQQPAHSSDMRVMDCVDCHNRATHIYEDPEEGLNARFASGELDPELPWLKREALGAILSNWQSAEAAQEGVAKAIRSFYRHNYPELLAAKAESIENAVASLQAMVARNLHPSMKITWGSYPNHLGHRTDDAGCFRCHNDRMVDEAGVAINNDCTLCHSILADESPLPYQYLMEMDPNDPQYHEGQYLKNEYFKRFY